MLPAVLLLQIGLIREAIKAEFRFADFTVFLGSANNFPDVSISICLHLQHYMHTLRDANSSGIISPLDDISIALGNCCIKIVIFDKDVG